MNRMKRILLSTLALLSILLVSSTILTSSSAADYTKIGVKTGDNATYSYSLVNSTVNLQGQVFVNVTKLTGTNATLNLKYYFSNGTLAASVLLGPDNVSTGYGGIGFFVACANLSVHDAIYLAAPFNINETVDMVAAGVMRTVNHLNITLVTSRYNIWWDKPTGLMVRINIVGPDVSPGLGNFTLTSTSLWSMPAGPAIPTTVILIVGAGAIIVVAAAAIVFYMRRK
jgi:hypothetical protein